MSSNNDSRNPLKRRSRSPPPWRQRSPQRPRHNGPSSSSSHHHDRKQQVALNALQENEQARAWVAQEDAFILQQSKKKAEIRVKEGRARPIDYLAVNLRVIDEDRKNLKTLDDEIPDEELDIVDPEGLLENLDKKELEDLEADIDTYIGLETNRVNSEFWKVCLPPFPIISLKKLTQAPDDENPRLLAPL